MKPLTEEDKKKFQEIWNLGSFEVHIRDLKYFISPSKDGFVIGYLDPSLKRGVDDHWTFLSDSKINIYSVHRTERTQQGTWFTKVNWSYISEPNGYIRGLIEIIKSDAEISLKIILPLLYSCAYIVYKISTKIITGARICLKEEAKKLGLSEKPVILLQMSDGAYNAFIMYTNSLRKLNKTKYEQRERNVPGLRITRKK